MIRVLIIIAAASFVLAVACLAGAAALGGREIAEHGWSFPANIHVRDGDEEVEISLGDGARDEPSVTRDLAWSGGPELRIALPGEVDFTQGSTAKITVTGPADLAGRVTMADGVLRLEDDGPRLGFHNQRLRVAVTAPAVKRFVVDGSPTLTIRDYDQPQLAVEINGSGDVIGHGRTLALSVAIAGSGDADLGQMQTQDASIDLSGSGDARVAPTGSARVSIAGSGDVRLLTKPTSLSRDIRGSGDLHLPD